MLVFPFAFVDTSDALVRAAPPAHRDQRRGPVQRPARRRRVLARGRALVRGTLRDILFQLAFAAYVGAFSNLNPLLDRDGYHMLVDWLGEPGLRKRARERTSQRLSGRGRARTSPARMLIYALAGLAWTMAGGHSS